MLWLVQAAKCDWDQYEAFVVRAPDEESALKLCLRSDDENFSFHPGFYESQGPILAAPIPLEGASEQILSSFNAG